MPDDPMNHRFAGDTLVVASHNAGKIREIRDLLGARVANIPSAGDFDLIDPEETGTSFAANAALKARFVADGTGYPALSDDSGLAVHALGGAPGIHTARWAERPDGSRDFHWGMQRLEAALTQGGHRDRSTHFVCALALAWPDGRTHVVEGVVHGTLTWPPRGDKGFGFDPVFIPVGHTITFGEMDPAAKHSISHRAEAFRRIVSDCF